MYKAHPQRTKDSNDPGPSQKAMENFFPSLGEEAEKKTIAFLKRASSGFYFQTTTVKWRMVEKPGMAALEQASGYTNDVIKNTPEL